MCWFVLSVERKEDGFGVERGAIVKGDTAPEVKRPGESICRILPRFGEGWFKLGCPCTILHKGIVNIVAYLDGFAFDCMARV